MDLNYFNLISPYHIAIAIFGFGLTILYASYQIAKRKNSLPKVGLFFVLQNKIFAFVKVIFDDLAGFWQYIFAQPMQQFLSKFDERNFDRLFKWSIWGVILVVLFAFVGTFINTQSYAAQHGLGFESYLLPFSIDLVTVMLGIAATAFSLTGTKKPAFVGFGIVGFVLLSSYFNVQESIAREGGLTLSALVIGLAFPGTLAAAIEIIQLLIGQKLQRSELVQSNEELHTQLGKLQKEILHAQAELTQLEEKLAQKKGVKPSKKELVHAQLEKGVTDIETIAKQTGAAERTVYAYIREYDIKNQNGKA